MYPFDRALALAPGRTQFDVQQAAAQVAIEMPYEEAQTLFSDLTGVALGSERLHTFVHQAAEGLTVLDVAPSRDDIARRIAEMATGRLRRPVVVLGIDGAYRKRSGAPIWAASLAGPTRLVARPVARCQGLSVLSDR